MKSRILLIIFNLFFIYNLVAQNEIKIDWDYSGMTFKEFVTTTENLYTVRFFFKDDWVNDIKTGSYKGPVALSELLNSLFSGTNLYYYADDSRNIIVTRNFAVKGAHNSVLDEGNFIPPTDYYGSKEDQELSGNLFSDIGNPADKNKTGAAVISGYITDRDTKEPVSGATVFVSKQSKGSMSNSYGFYSLSLPRSSHQIQFSFIGMKEKLVNINLYGPGELNVQMNSTLIPLQETVISARKSVMFKQFEVGVEKINIASFRLLPTSMGEADIFKSVLLVPGVQSVGEGSAGFNVRGGSADQNLILLYGSPIYNSSHFFGFFSVVNSDIIKDVTLYKGGIPGRYGGRISSVLDIGAKDGNRAEFAGSAGISPVTAHLAVEGPIIKDTLTYIITGRSTYSNWLFELFEDPALRNSRASFYDVNAKVTYDLNRNNKFDFSSYTSHDSFRLNSDSLYSYENNILALRRRHFFSSRFFSAVSVNNSNYSYNVSSNNNPFEGFDLSHRINSTGVKADINWYQGRSEVNFGLDMIRYVVNPGSYTPSGDSSLVIPNIIDKEKAMEADIYIDEKLIINDYLSVNAGIRLSSFFAFGSRSVLLYDPSSSKNMSTIIDTLDFSKNEIYRAYAGPEFRLSLNFKTSSKSSLKVNYNRTRQYLHLLSNTTSISPTDTWKLSDYYLKPQIGDQFATGFYLLLGRGIETSAEIYYKKIKNMVDYKGGAKLVMNEYVEKDLVNVRGKAYGLELMIKKVDGRVRGSLAYTYSRTFIRSTGKFSDEIINSGTWFPASFDKPNDLVTTVNYLFSRRLSFSTNYTWSTGRPITFPVATYFIDDLLLVHYSDRNKYRIPDYSRLDVSVKISGSLRSRKITHPNWIFSVYNLLGRQNVYSIYFKQEGETINGYKLSVFGRAIPSLTYSFDF